MTDPSHSNDASNFVSLQVPEDFPRYSFPASLSGAQPKFSARLIDGRYVVGPTEDELKARFLMCSDLVDQLTSYTERKRLERKDLTLVALLDQVDMGIRIKGWEVDKLELDWIMKQLRAKFLGGKQPEQLEDA
jgi:hypothetical protein